MLVLCSSISAITAPMGEIGYVSANSFLDGFAAYNRLANKVRTISINWGAWKDVGMAVKSVARLGLNSSILKDEIPSEDGLRAFERIIAEDYDQVIVSPKNLNITLKENGKKTILKSSSSKGEQRPDLNVDYLAPDNQIEQQLTEMWRNILGIEKVGVNDNFFDLGANSIDLVQLNNMLLKEYNKNIPVVKLYEYTTIKKLADFIDQGGQVAVADIAQGTIIEGERENKLRQRKSRVTNLD
jgi:acyl carrier protein